MKCRKKLRDLIGIDRKLDRLKNSSKICHIIKQIETDRHIGAQSEREVSIISKP